MKPISVRDYIVASGIIPVRKIGDEYLFLMLGFKGYWEFPKGHVEQGENFFEAALRETEEECSLSASDLDFMWGDKNIIIGPSPNKNKIIVYYLASTNKENIVLPINPELGKPEHDEYRWVNKHDARKLANKRIRKAIDWAVKVIDERA